MWAYGCITRQLLLRYGAKSSPKGSPRIVLGYFISKELLLYPPHAVVIRLQGRIGRHVVILMPETADLLRLRGEAGLVCKTRMPNPRHRGLTAMWTVFFSLSWWEII